MPNHFQNYSRIQYLVHTIAKSCGMISLVELRACCQASQSSRSPRYGYAILVHVSSSPCMGMKSVCNASHIKLPHVSIAIPFAGLVALADPLCTWRMNWDKMPSRRLCHTSSGRNAGWGAACSSCCSMLATLSRTCTHLMLLPAWRQLATLSDQTRSTGFQMLLQLRICSY